MIIEDKFILDNKEEAGTAMKVYSEIVFLWKTERINDKISLQFR